MAVQQESSGDWGLQVSQEFLAIWNRLATLTEVDIHQLNAVCAENSRPDGDRSAIVAVFLQQIETFGSVLSAWAQNAEFAKIFGERIDTLRERLIGFYASRLETMEVYFPGLTQEVRQRLFGRTEHWKAVALLNGLAAEHSPLSPTSPQPSNPASVAVDRATPEPGSGVPATEKATAKQAAKTSAGLLKDARKKASLSRPDAARELLVDPDTIKKHEEGKAFPRSALRAAYATLYKKSENELFPIVP